MLDQTPWLVSQEGVMHSSEVARSLAYAATAGKEGIMGPTELRVTAMSTPTGKVRVSPGVASVLSRYPGASTQSYIARNISSTDVTISPTSSTGPRNDLLVLRISDTGLAGTAPADVNNYDYARFEVIQGVPASTSSVSDLNLTYPAIALALIKIPASTSAITNSMITDLRKLANPRTEDVWFPMPTLATEGEALEGTGPVGEWFINAAVQTVDIPSWAVRMQVRVDWLSVRYSAGNAYGQVWLEYGPYKGPSERERKTQEFQWDSPAVTSVSRGNLTVVDDVYIPKAYRGTSQLFVPKGRKAGGSGMMSFDGLSGMSIQIRFLETADDDLL